jgi:RimJ/RimL family protein N-acetyltransferase
MSGHPVLSTPRLILRPWKDSDCALFAGINSDPRVMEHFPKCLDRSESDAMVRRIRDTFDNVGYGLWAVEVPGIAEFIGFVGLNAPRFEAFFTPNLEVGWRLSFDHWGKGFATEAAHAALQFGFDVLKREEIVSYTVPANSRSRRVMERLGMTHKREEVFEHPFLPEGHALRLHVLYRLSARQFRTPEPPSRGLQSTRQS